MSAAYQRDYLVRLPLPLAQLYVRAYNGKDARSRHQNTFYLFESSIKLAACALVAAYRDELRRGGARSANLDARVARLALPSLGDWRDLVREGARHFGERPAAKSHPLTHVWNQLNEPRRDRPALLELYRRIKNGPDGKPGGDKSCSIMQVFDALVPYRNLVIGHGADRSDAFYDRDMGPRLFPAANELLAEGTFDMLGPSGTRLVYANQVRKRDDNRFEIDLWDLVGLEGERGAEVLLIEADVAGDVRPNQVSVLWPGYKLPLSIDPLLVYRDVGDRRELRFLNGDRNGKHVEYLSYTSGMIDRDASTVAALFELLRTVTGSSPSGEPTSPPSDAAPAEYEILGRLGKGSTGKVYLARQLSLGRLVALKTLAPDLAGDPLAVARFRREIETLARCDDPHIVKILSHGKLPDGTPYYAMEYVPGADLDLVFQELTSQQTALPAAQIDDACLLQAAAEAARKQQASLSTNMLSATTTTHAPEAKLPSRPYLRRMVAIARDAARALQVVHEQGLIHRDVKPGNLMLAPDASRVVLMDFGLAKRQSQSLTQSWTAGLPRSARYAAPEQLAGANVQVGPAADVRGLGATFWELLARRRLFADAQGEQQLAAWVLHRDVPRLRAVDPSIDADLEAIVDRATERSAEARIQTARELADYLDLYLADKPLPIRPPSAREVLARWARQNRALVATAAMSLLAIVAVTAVSFALIVRSRDAAVFLAGTNDKLAKAEALTRKEAEQERNKAEQARDETERQLQISTALRLSAESQLVRDDNGVRAVLLATEALQTAPRSAESALPTVLQAAYDSLASIGGRPLTEPRDGLHCVALSNDGRWLATSGDDKTVRVTDLISAEQAPGITLAGSSGQTTILMAFSSDDRRLAAADSDRAVQLWDLTNIASAGIPKQLVGHDDDLTALAFSPDGAWLATAGEAGSVRLWPTADERPESRVLRGPSTAVRTIAFSHDGRQLAAGGANDSAYLWTIAGSAAEASTLALRGHVGSIECLSFSPDGRWLATGSFDRTARLWDLTQSQPAESSLTLRAHDGPVRTLCFSLDGHWLATGGEEGGVQLWDLEVENPEETAMALRRHRLAVSQLAFSVDSDWLLSGGRDHQVCLWEIGAHTTAGPTLLRGHEAEIAALAFDREGERIVTASADGVARRWHRDGRDLSAACMALPGHADAVWSLAFSPDRRWIATTSREKVVRLWGLDSDDPAEAKVVLNGHTDNVKELAFSRDGAWLATGSWDKTARLWNLKDADPSASSIVLEGHRDEVSVLVFSNDGHRLATAGWDKTARVWNMEKLSGNGVPQVLSQSVAVTAAAFDHVGERLATAGDDGSVRVWKLTDPTPAANALTVPAGNIITLSFTDNDNYLVVAGTGGVYCCDTGAAAPSMTNWIAPPSTVPIIAAAKSSDGWLTVATHEQIAWWPLVDGSPKRRSLQLATSRGKNAVLAIASAARHLALSQGDLVDLWQPDDEQPTALVLRGHDGGIASLAFSPDGKWLAGGCEDGAARLWPLKIDDLVDLARRAAGRDLTRDETRSYRIERMGQAIRELRD